MATYYKNKTVWVTGASSGIGKAMCLQLASEQAHLVISSEDKDGLKELAKQCNNLGSECEIVEMDLSETKSVKRSIEKVLSTYSKIDVLILNAGISQRATAIDTSLEMNERIMQINFYSNVMITKAILPRMIEQGGGHIGVTSSISGKFGFYLRSAYAASKHALHGYFESVSLENISNNIYVTIVCPGRVKTNISINALKANGKQYGKMDDGQLGGISAEKCAKKYLKAIRKRKKEKLIGGKELLMVYIKRFCPRLFYRIAKNINEI